MKTIALFVTLMIFVKSSYSQFAKGSHLIKISIGAIYNSNSATNYHDTSLSNILYSTDEHPNYIINLHPLIGFFIKENLMLSVGPDYSYWRSENIYTQYDTGTNIGPYTQKDLSTTNYYGGKIALEKFSNLFGRLFLTYSLVASYSYGNGEGYLKNSAEVEYTNHTYSDNISATIGAGFYYQVDDRWLLNGGISNLGWSTTWSKTTKYNSSDLASKSTDSRFSISALYVSFGLSFMLRK